MNRKEILFTNYLEYRFILDLTRYSRSSVLRLVAIHYLNWEKERLTEWKHRENNQISGRMTVYDWVLLHQLQWLIVYFYDILLLSTIRIRIRIKFLSWSKQYPPLLRPPAVGGNGETFLTPEYVIPIFLAMILLLPLFLREQKCLILSYL